MTAVQKFFAGIIGIAMVTTLILPDRKTTQVIDAAGRFTQGVLGTAMTGKA